MSSKHHHSSSCLKCHKSSSSGQSSNISCTYAECSKNSASCNSTTCSKSTYACCAEVSNNKPNNDRSVCSCRYRLSESGEREREHTCQKCLVEMENHKTKSKLDQLRLVMMQRKQKREARKLKGAPYGARVVTATSDAAGNSAVSATSSQNNASNASEVNSTQHNMVEEVDTAA